MSGDQTDKLRLSNDLLVCAQKPGEPSQILCLFSIKPLLNRHPVNRCVLKGHVLIFCFPFDHASALRTDMRAIFSNGEKLQLLLKSLKSIRANIMNSSQMSKLINRARLDELIAEATLDCNGEEEEHTALLTIIEDQVVCPFRAKVIGATVEVTRFEGLKSGYGMLAVCRRKGHAYRGHQLLGMD